jgi:L-threonylcarbamoyladenylate synthase
LILKKRLEVPDLVTAGLDTVAVRVPSHRVARALMEMAAVPIAAPSANRFSRPSPTTAAHVLEDLDGRVDLVLDGGPTDIGLESTIVDFTTDPPVMRRPGGITLEQLHALVPEIVAATGQANTDQPQVAPGQMTRHYAPRAALTLYDGPIDAVRRRVAADLRSLTAAGERVGVLAPEEDLAALAPEMAARASAGRIETIPYGSRSDLEQCGRGLYAAIRAIDASGVTQILAVGVGAEGLGRAIHDRLTRAADGRVRNVS